MEPNLRQASHEIAGLKAKALAAASDILASQGAEALNLRAIAESAGIGISSIYHYFANKEQLLLSLGVKGFDDLAADITRHRADPEHPTPIAAGARAYFGFAETRPALFSVMFSERLLARHETLRAAEHRTFLAFQAGVDTDGRFPADQTGNVAVALWALGRGIAAMISSQPGGQLPTEIAARLWAGVRYLLVHPR